MSSKKKEKFTIDLPNLLRFGSLFFGSIMVGSLIITTLPLWKKILYSFIIIAVSGLFYYLSQKIKIDNPDEK